MALTYAEYMKKKEELEKGSSSQKKTNTSDTTSTTPETSLYDTYVAQREAVRDTGYNPSFQMLGSTYVVDKNNGQNVKVNPFAYQKTEEEKARQAAKIAQTGHNTFDEDFGNALSGGLQSWGANQLSTVATLGLAGAGLINRDNNYQPKAGSTLWKLTQASNASTNAANRLLESSKEGRGKVGQLVMDVGSQAVMNGIDAAIKSIPGIGQVAGTISFASRAFGGTAQQARDEGKSIATQVLTGGVSAAIEAATEAMWGYGGVRSYSGKMVENSGLLGNLTNMAETALAKKAGPVLSKLAMSFGTEAVEEMLADVLNPVVTSVIQNYTKDSKLFSDYEAEEWQGIGNMLYDGLVGGISGIGGGLYESASAISDYNNVGKDKAKYAENIRDNYISSVRNAREQNNAAKEVRRQSIADAVDTIFSKKTGRSVLERASEASGKLVSRKQAFSLLNNASEDLAKIYHDIAKNFAENNVANEVINKKVLENAVFNYLATGEFANELNSADDAKAQIQALSKHIMAEYISDLEQKAKSKRNKVQQTFYGSLLSRFMNERFADQQTQATEEEDVTEATPFRTTMDEVEADRAARMAETPNEPIRYTDRYENEDLPWVTNDEVEQNEGQVFQPARETVSKTSQPEMAGETTETVQNEPVQEVSQTENAEEKQTVLTKAEQKKADRLFSGQQKSIVLPVDQHNMEVLAELRARADAEGKELVEKNRKDGRKTISLREKAQDISDAEADLEEQHAKIADIAEQLGVELDNEDNASIKRHAAGNAHYNATMYFKYGNQKRSDVKAENTFDAILNGERTATTREKQWKGHEQWKKTNVGDTVTFSENAGGNGRTVDVRVTGKYDVLKKLDNNTILVRDADGNEQRITREQWSKKEGWAENSKWFDEIKPGDIWINYERIDSQPTNRLYTQKKRNRPLSLTLKYVLAGRANELTGSELNEAFKHTLDKAGLKRNSKYLLDNISDYIFGNFENQTSQQVFDSTRQKGENYLATDYSYVTAPENSKLQNQVRNDTYSQESEEELVTPNEIANALFYLIKEYDNRRFDINSYVQLSRKGNTQFDVGDEETVKPNLTTSVEYTDDDATGEIINTLHEEYGEGFPTEDAIKLRRSLMSGFAPSDKFGVGDLSVEERLTLLREAFPDEDFSISHYNETQIVDSSTVGEDEEAQREERNWNRRNLKDEVNNPAKNAFGYIPVDSNKKSQIGTNSKGEPIYASGFVDVNKTSVNEKRANQRALNLREEVSRNVEDIRKQIANIDKAIKHIRTTLEATENEDFRQSLNEQIESLTATSKELSDNITKEQARLTDELGYNANWNSTIREEKRNAVNETWIDRLPYYQLDKVFGDGYNGYYNDHKLTEGEAAYGKELLDRYNAQRDNRPLGRTADGYNSVQMPANNYGYDDRRGVGSQPYTPTASEVRRLPQAKSLSFSDGRTRISYDGVNYISVFDDYDGGKQVGFEIPDSETVGEAFDNARNVFSGDKSVKRIIFLRGSVYDSYNNQLCGGITVFYNNGDKVILLAADNDADFASNAVHERTHLDLESARANGVKGLKGRNYYKVVADIVGMRIDSVIERTVVDGGYDASDFDGILDEIVCNSVAGKNCYHIDHSQYTEGMTKFMNGVMAGEYKHEFRDKALEAWAGNRVKNVDFSKLKRFSTGNEDNIPTLAEYNERIDEERRQDRLDRQARQAAGEERYQAARRADKAVPTLDEFTKAQAEQPVASKKMSPSEAWELAKRTFGAMHKRITRAAKNFQKLNSPFANDVDGKKYGSKGKIITDKLGDMFQSLADVNDGYATIKDVADLHNSWRDDNVMKDYWSEEVADRFKQILSDADDAGWTFAPQQQREVAQAFEEAVNAMRANIVNTDKSTVRLASLAGEAVTNKLNLKKDGLLSKAIQKYLRYQFTPDTAFKFFGGFKGKGEFYKLSSDIKNSVAKRMVEYVNAYSYFDDVKKMEGFDKFAADDKTYKLDPHSEFLSKNNPMGDHEFTLQQIVTIKRLYDTLYETFKHSDDKINERVQGFVVRDAKGNSFTVDLTSEGETAERQAMDRTNQIYSVLHACEEILDQDTPEAKAAKAYSKACDKMFAALGKDVSAVKKQLTGNGLSLIGDNYTPVLWANEDGTPADFNFNYDDERLRPPRFLYKRTGNAGYLVVSPISYIVDKYIQSASDYVGMGQTRDMLTRLNNGTSLDASTKSLATTLGENFGKDAGAWFNEYVKDLTTYQENDSIFAELRRRLQQGALIGSPSVMMKQTSSYWSAMGLLSPEALTMAYRWKVGMKATDWSELNEKLKYRKISNNIDPTLTEIIRSAEKYGAASKSKVLKLFTNGISAQDQKTVDNLYLATEYDTILKNMDKGAEYFTSEQYLADVDAKFTEVMMRSQPMFDTELRAEYARTDNEFIKMLSMFRTQQTQNLNLIMSAIGEYNASKGTDARGEKAQVLRQTVGGQVTAAVSLALLSVAADFMLHGLKKYRGDGDDEDEEPGDGKISVQRMLNRIGMNAVEAQAGTFWGGDYLAKWLIDKMSGGETNEFYGINMGPITTLQNIVQNLEYVVKSPTPSNIKNTATYISQACGFPLNNAYRIINSAIMYTADLTGKNPDNYDDFLKAWSQDVKMSEKNNSARNLLVEGGMSKKEAKSFINDVDVNRNGLSQTELKDYYVEHPEDGDKVSVLWDSMGFSKTWAKTQPSLDKKVLYKSNPLYAEMDEDESGSVSKTELTNYYLEHPDEKAEIEQAYDALGMKGSFKSAIKSAETAQKKEVAEQAFEDGDYNLLFDTISGMKSGKSVLTNLIREETDDYDTSATNLLFDYLSTSNVDDATFDTAVESFGGDKLISQYKLLRKNGYAPKDAISRIEAFDANSNGSITQAELAEYYKAHKDEEAVIEEFWSACGWSTTWAKYKKSKKIA